jgi:acyl-CoA oxidase
MGKKTIGNDLDNAWVCFKDVVLPKECLLNKFADIVDNNYVIKVKGIRNFDMIG